MAPAPIIILGKKILQYVFTSNYIGNPLKKLNLFF